MALLASGQVTATTTPQPLSATPIKPRFWVLKAAATNTAQAGLGPAVQSDGVTALAMSNAYLMDPGDDLEIDRTIQQGAVYEHTPVDLYVVCANGQTVVVSWLAFG